MSSSIIVYDEIFGQVDDELISVLYFNNEPTISMYAFCSQL